MVASIALIAGIVLFSIRSQDAVAVRDSEHLVRSVLLDRKERLRDQLLDYSYWDEAVDQVVVNHNKDWADANIGVYMHDRFGIDASYVVAPDGTVTYAMIDGERTDHAQPTDDFGESFQTLLERARAAPADVPPIPVTGYMQGDGNDIYITGMSVLSRFKADEDGNLGTGWVLVFQRRMSDDFLAALSDRYLLNNLSIAFSPKETANGRMALVSPIGDQISQLSWEVESEFSKTMSWLAPFFAVMFLVFGLLAILFFSRSRRILKVLTENLIKVESAQRERNQALIRARTASQAKSRFLANMSHELRTPLNAIIGMSDMMRHGVFGKIENERYTGYLDDMHSSARHLLRLINDVLDISAIEAGKLTLSMEPVSIEQLYADGLAVIRQAAEEKGITFIADSAEDIPSIVADHRSLTQIMVNLLNNAVKYTPAGGKFYLTAEADDDAHTFTIRDTGMGIPAHILPRITEPFIRAHEDPDLAIEGTGLGLSITKELLTAHNGTLEIESEVDVGTTVRIRIPRNHEDQIDLFDPNTSAA